MKLDTRSILQSGVPSTKLNKDAPQERAKAPKIDYAIGTLAEIVQLQTMPEILRQLVALAMEAVGLIPLCDRRVHQDAEQASLWTDSIDFLAKTRRDHPRL